MAIHWEIWLGNVVDKLNTFLDSGEQKSDEQVRATKQLRYDLLRVYSKVPASDRDLSSIIWSMKQSIRSTLPKPKRSSGGSSFFSTSPKTQRKSRLSRASSSNRGRLLHRMSSRVSLTSVTESDESTTDGSNALFDMLRALHDIDVAQQTTNEDKLGGNSAVLSRDRFSPDSESLKKAQKYLEESSQALGLSTSTSASTSSDLGTATQDSPGEADHYTNLSSLASGDEQLEQQPITSEADHYVNLSRLVSEDDQQGYQPITAGLRSESRENEQALYADSSQYGDISQLLSPEEYAEQTGRGKDIAFYEDCLAITLFNLDCYRKQKLPQIKYPEIYRQQGFNPRLNPHDANLAKEIGRQLIAQYLHPQLEDDGFLDAAAMTKGMLEVLRKAVLQCTQGEKTLFQMLNSIYEAIGDETLTENSSYFAQQVKNPFLAADNPQAAQQYAQLHIINTVRQYYQDYLKEMNNQLSGSPGDPLAKLEAAQIIVNKLGSYFRKPENINRDIDALQNGHAKWHVKSGDIPILKLIESICDKNNNALEGIGKIKPRFSDGRYGEVLGSVSNYLTEVGHDPNSQNQYNLDY